MAESSRWERYERYPYLLAKYGGFALIVGLVAALLYRLRVVVIPILIACVLAYLLAPIVDFLERHRIRRVIASGLVVLLALVAIGALLLLVLPTILWQAREIVERIPDAVRLLNEKLGPTIAERFGVEWHLNAEEIATAVRANIESLAAPSAWIISRVFKSVVTIGLFIFFSVVVTVFTFYLLRSYNIVIESIYNLIPDQYKKSVAAAAKVVDEALAGFIRGQIGVCVIMAALYSIALSVIGVRGGTMIGLLTGILNFIPYFGTLTGLVLSLLSVALDYSGLGQIVAVVGVFLVGPLFDATVVTPNIVGQRVGLNPLLVIVALLAGAELLGFLGLLLAVPTAAVLRALVRLWLPAYRKSISSKRENGTENG